MKKYRVFKTPILLAGLLTSTASFADYPDSHSIENSCQRTAYQLHNLVSKKPDDRCAGDVIVAAAYIEAAGLKVHYQKFQQALTSIKYCEKELRKISSQRTYCKSFAEEVKPLIAEVIKISSEIEIVENYQLKKTMEGNKLH